MPDELIPPTAEEMEHFCSDPVWLWFLAFSKQRIKSLFEYLETGDGSVSGVKENDSVVRGRIRELRLVTDTLSVAEVEE